MNSEHPLFSVSNYHSAGCGEPPTINGDEPGYHSYFENEHGEQSLFIYNYDSESGTVWCGTPDGIARYPVDSGDEIDTLPLSGTEQCGSRSAGIPPRAIKKLGPSCAGRVRFESRALALGIGQTSTIGDKRHEASA